MPTVIDGITGINRITGGADVGGNLDFVAAGSRITGDFSNATHTNRTILQTSTVNSQTNIGAAPNGTSDLASFTAFSSSAAANCSFTQLFCDSSLAKIISGAIGSGTNLPLAFITVGAERMRIDVNGDLLIAKTANNFQTKGVQYEASNGALVTTNANSRSFAVVRTGTDGEAAIFYKGVNQVGNISVTTTTTAYNTSSDYRLKENIRAMVAPLERLLRLKPVLFNWKIDGSEGEGFIAHQLQQEVPIAVSGEKDGEQMQGVDASKVVPLLVAAVQELTRKVLALEAKLQ